MNELYREDWFEDARGIIYTPTDIRLENIQSDIDFYAKAFSVVDQKRIIIFTHEWQLSSNAVKRYMEWFCKMSKQFNINCKFPEDMIGENEE